MNLFSLTLNVDGESAVALAIKYLETITMTLAEVKALAEKTQADVQTLITADKAKIADLQAKLDAANAAADQPTVDAIGASLAATDALVQPMP